MAEENPNVQQDGGGASEDTKLVIEMKAQLDALKKENTQLKSDKSTLLNNFINNQPDTTEEKPPVVIEQPKEKKTEEKLAKEFNDLVKSNPTNLEMAKKMIEMDDWYIENNGESIFLPKGREVVVTENERATAERVHSALETCIEQANDDPRIFNATLAKVCPGRFPEKKLPTK